VTTLALHSVQYSGGLFKVNHEHSVRVRDPTLSPQKPATTILSHLHPFPTHK
jgi:hypothetical protein